MLRKIKITAGDIEVMGELKDTRTAEAIWQSLPIVSKVNTWGDEIYFSIQVKIGPENPLAVVSEGDLGYWPPGKAFCIFFGPTPASKGNEIRPASPVNVFGKIIGNPKVFKEVSDNTEIKIEQAGGQ